ncbi:hypothetical protein N9B45_00370 [bacterium]|nr:hypothetical protein [bacterium]
MPSRIMQNLKNYVRMTSMCLAIGISLFAFAAETHAQTEEVMAQENEEVQKFFEQAHDALDDALNLFDDAETRPEEGDLRFYDFLSRTKESQTRKVESYLDVAGEALGISSISNRRQLILDSR